MIRVRYVPGSCRLEVRGHAGSGEMGHDLVCAGVSTLVLTLGEQVKRLEAAGALRIHVLAADPGAAQIWCTPNPGREWEVNTVFETILTGMKLLSNKFSTFVEVNP